MNTQGPSDEHLESSQQTQANKRLAALLDTAWMWQQRAPKKALSYAQEAYELAQSLNNQHAQANSLITLSLSHYKQNYYQNAVNYGHKALELLALLPDQDTETWAAAARAVENKERVSLLLSAVSVSSFRLGDYQMAVLYASREVQFKRIMNDPKGEAFALHGLGWSYHRIGLSTKALELHKEALGLLEAIHEPDISGPLNGIAAVYNDMNRLDDALMYAQRSYDVLRQNRGSRRGLSTALGLFGLIYLKRKDFTQAASYFQRALEASEGFETFGVALHLINLGDTHFAKRDYATALKYYQQAATSDTQDETFALQTRALLRSGQTLLAQQQYDEAVALCKQVLERMPDTPSVEAYLAHFYLSQAFKEQSAFELALAHHEQFHRLKEAVLTNESNIRTKVLMIQYDAERIQQAQALDRLERVELSKAYEELKVLHNHLEQQTKELERLSNLDGLTGLYNRRYLDARLSYELSRFQRYGKAVSVMMSDIDNFKQINDSFTHTVGDRVLKTLATLVKSNIREIDIAARYGGEEIVIIFPETSLHKAAEASEKLRELVQNFPWHRIQAGLAVTVSIGVATSHANQSTIDLLRDADENMYRAKRAGKNKVVYE